MGIGSSSSEVKEENPSIYDFGKAVDKSITSQEGNYLLYLFECKTNSDNNGGSLSIVLYNPVFSAKCFHLLELTDTSEAKEKFRQLADHLRPFVKYIESIYDVESLHNIILQFKNNPNWTASHVAAELEITECFENAEFMNEMENSLKSDDITPLHIACKDGKKKTIRKLFEIGPNFSKDFLGNTPIHYLIENHPELVEAASSFTTSIGDHFKESLNTLNQYSESPVHVAIRLSQEKVLSLLIEKGANCRLLCGHMYAIHLALKNKSYGCAVLLIKQDSSCVYDKDLKYGALPLHWAKTSQMADLLIENGVDLNCRNENEDAPLHVMARKKRLSCIVTLISNGADINVINKDGRNSLHLAVEAEDPDIVRGLLLFGIDHELKDSQGLTAFDIAKGKQDSTIMSEIKNALNIFSAIHRGPASDDSSKRGILEQAKAAYNEVKYIMKKPLQTDSNAASILKNKTGKEAVLCMDGGGIRGLVLTELLFALEEVTGHPISKLFDWVSGTSTGSYLALAVATGKSVEHAQKAYFRLKERVFHGSRPFLSEPLENFLIDEFGKETMMSSFSHPRVIIPAMIADRKPAALHLFRNYDAPYDEHFWTRDTRFKRPRKPQELELWRAARCSGAAPSYFRAMDRYIDGGMIANNPTLDVLAEIHNYKKHNEIRKKKEAKQSATPNDVAMASDVTVRGTNDNLGIVISLGTGRAPQVALKGIDIFKPSTIWETTELLVSARDFGELLVDQVTNSDDHVVERAKSWCEMVGLSYFRFNPPLSNDVELDEQSDNVLINMLWDARIYLHKNRDLVEKAGRILLGCD